MKRSEQTDQKNAQAEQKSNNQLVSRKTFHAYQDEYVGLLCDGGYATALFKRTYGITLRLIQKCREELARPVLCTSPQ